MAKKIFGVSNSLSKGIKDTLNAVENNLNNFRFNIVKLTEIEIDPDNQRDLSIIEAYQVQFKTNKITASLIQETTGLSLPQATYYYQVIHASSEIQDAIENGVIKNLDKAAFLSSISNLEFRKEAIAFCCNGAT